MTTRARPISHATPSRRFLAPVLIGATLLLSSHAALAQFSQDGQKLVGTLASGAAAQGWSVAVSADGNTAIVGGPYDNANTGAAWIYTRNGEVWTQQSGKLVGTGAVGKAFQGISVAISGNGDTAIVGGPYDNTDTGAAWVFTRSGGAWSQQGEKLVGTGAVGAAYQGWSVALSADGATAVLGGPEDNSLLGAAWAFTRSFGVWSQQGEKLVGTDAVGPSRQGTSVALSANGDTAIVGAISDDADTGAAWIYTLSGGVWIQAGDKLVGTGQTGLAYEGWSVALSANGDTALVGGPYNNTETGGTWVFALEGAVWTQQAGPLVGTGAVGSAYQGWSVALSADGDTAFLGGYEDNTNTGASWVFTSNAGVWTQQGGKLVGTGAVGAAQQGYSVALSGDGDTAIVGGNFDNTKAGAAWVFVQPLEVSGYAGIAASGKQGGPFTPSSFSYKLSATSGSVKYAIANVPSWLTASSTKGTVTTSGTTITFTVNSSADKLATGDYVGSIDFNNDNKEATQASIPRAATLTVKPK
jgi:antibiotic biosynthesis monooxygenase (ABM) superfamily enzyme